MRSLERSLRSAVVDALDKFAFAPEGFVLRPGLGCTAGPPVFAYQRVVLPYHSLAGAAREGTPLARLANAPP